MTYAHVLAALVLILLVGVAAWFWRGRQFRRQLGSFDEQTTLLLDSGDLSRRLQVKKEDEFASLAGNMNAMVERLEQQVRQARQTGDNIAHDLRTPLTRLRADIEGALRRDDPDAHRETLSRALSELQGMQQIIDSLLAISRAEGGGMRVKRKAVDLSGLLEEMADLYGPSAEEKALTLESRIEPHLLVDADRQLVARILANLLDNALKYVPAGGKVALLASYKGDRVEISVEDSGPGIPLDMREKVFERFARLDPSRTLPGAGLGLSLVKAFLELLHGNIRITDSRLGGAAFVVNLPAH
jgi:signal transduction histidine kinase